MTTVRSAQQVKRRKPPSGALAGLRIGYYTPNFPGVSQDGGIGSNIRSLGCGLTKLGHRVTVLTPGTGADCCDGPLDVAQVPTRYLPVADRILPGIGACWHVAHRMSRLVRERQIDIVEFPNWEGLGVLFQQISRVPVIVRLYTSSQEAQAIDGQVPNRVRRWDVLRERWQSHAADAVVTHSRAHRDAMAMELEIAPARIRILPLGIPVYPDFSRAPRDASPPTVVYLGRLEKRKGTLDLLAAIPQVLRHIPAARFVLIGTDRPHCPGGRSHAQFLRDEFPGEVQRRVQLLGRLPQSEVDRWLQSADVFVAPSLYESFGLIFPEAMRWGTPVIGTRVGGIPEIVTDGQTGLLVEPQQPAELAAAMLRLLTNRDLSQRLGCAGRKHVETEFNVERMARSTVELYSELIQNKSSSRRRDSRTTSSEPRHV